MDRQQTPIEKMRSIVNWANAQSEYINDQFKSIQAVEQAYDYCKKNGFEFIDDDYINCLEPSEVKKLSTERKKWFTK